MTDAGGAPLGAQEASALAQEPDLGQATLRCDLPAFHSVRLKGARMPLRAIGVVTKTDGREGDVLVKLHPEEDYAALAGLEWLLTKVDGEVVPLRVGRITRRGPRSATVSLTHTRTLALAQRLVGCPVMSPDDADDEPTDLAGLTLTDFHVRLANGTEVGIVERIDDSVPANPLLVVRTPSGERLIPAVDEWVVDLDSEERTLTLDLPEGLL